MRILLIHQYFLGPAEGGGSRFNQLTRYWRQSGHAVTVIAGMVHYATGRRLPEYRGRFAVRQVQEDGVRVWRTYVSPGYNRSYLGRLWAYLSFALSSTLAGLLQPRPEVTLVTSPPLFVGLAGFLLSRLKRSPLLFEVRDLWPESAIETGVLTSPSLIGLSYWLERLCYRWAAKVVVLTPAFRQVLVTSKGIPPDKIVLIPNGADLDLFAPGPRENWVRAQYGLTGKFVVTYLGAHGVANGLLTLVEAAAILKEAPDIHFLLVGDGMEKAVLRKRIAELGLANMTLVATQPKSAMPDFCNASDACTAMLKRADVFKTVYPNKVFDYMACARPVILAIDGAARELVADRAQAGIFVPPEDSRAFAEAVLKLRDDGALCARLGENGRAFVQGEFSREALARRYEEVLREVAHSEDRGG